MKRLIFPILAILLSSCSTNSGFQANEQSFVSGNGIVTFVTEKDRDVAPLIKGPLLDGGELKVTSGKVKVINVWASWCSPCRAEAPALQELATKHPEVEFIGILTRDNLVAARAFVTRFGIGYPTIIDDAILADFSGLLSVNAIPTTLVIDKNGRMAARISGEITFSTMDDLIERVNNE